MIKLSKSTPKSKTTMAAATEEETSQANDAAGNPDGEDPKSPTAKEGDMALSRLTAAWSRAPRSVKRDFLTSRLDDPEDVELIKEVIPKTLQKGSARKRRRGPRSRDPLTGIPL
jgi:hypothetical protein